MEHAHGVDERRSNTPPDRDILLRTQPPESRRDHQERRLQLLLQETEELNARLREQLASPKCGQSQQPGDSIPTTRRRDVEPTPKARSLNVTRSQQHNLESRKRQRECLLSQTPPSDERIPYRTADSEGLSAAGSSRTSPFGRASDLRTRQPANPEVRSNFPQERLAYAKSLPRGEETDSHTTRHRTNPERPPPTLEALHPAFKHPRQAAPDEISRRLDDMLSTPFGQHIIAYEHRAGYVVPKFSLYDGSTDPFDHLMHFRQVMVLEVGNDALLCKIFPASLMGAALSWFHRLPPFTIHTFRELSEAFVNRYLCSVRTNQTVSTLQNIKMTEGESLRSFMKRFGQTTLQVESYSVDAIL